MTEDPVRLLSQDDDAFTTSLLRSAKEGDRDAARAHKALVLGAAGSAVAGTAVLATAARLSPKGLFSSVIGKWVLAGIVVVSGGIGAAVLWPPGDGGDERATSAQAASEASATVGVAVSTSGLMKTGPVDQGRDAPPPEKTSASDDSKASDPASDVAANDAKGDPAGAASNGARPDPAGAPSDGKTGGASNETGRATRPSSAATNDSEDDRPAKAIAETPGNQASSAPSTPGSAGLAEEVTALKKARDALASGQGARCLDAVNAYFAAFPKGHLAAEARYLRVEALYSSGRRDEAKNLASLMLSANPKSPYAARLRTIAGDAAPL